MIMLLSFILTSLCLGLTVASTSNKDVSVVIDATGSIVRYTAQVKTKNVDGEYNVVFPTHWATHLAFLSINSQGEELEVKQPVSQKNFTIYSVETKETAPQFKIHAVFTGLLEPYPLEIEQNDNQLVRLEGNHYFNSPYPTETQKSVVKLSSTAIESFSKLSPFAVRGSSLHFGPYKDVPAFAVSPLKVHYTNNSPFAKFSSMIREVEVSHWGSISVEEIYELQHAGAKLKNGFSRFEYQLRRGSPSASFRNLITYLPNEATNIYYRDQIGNISTSELTLGGGKNREKLEMDIQTRFPLYGGWQTQFYIGYSVPTELFLTVDTIDGKEAEGKYKLKVDFSTQFQNVWVEELELKVILPEGSSEIDVKVPYEAQQSSAIRYSYLDSKLNGGRTVIILKAKNLVEEHNEKKIEIRYSFPKNRMIVEPIMIIGSFFIFFVICSILSRASLVRVSTATTTSSEKKQD